jgi:hypothetical protein
MTISLALPAGSSTRPRNRKPYRTARASCLVVVLIAVFALYSKLSPRANEVQHLERRSISLAAEDLEVGCPVHSFITPPSQ